jgi:hypothetical protein
MHAALIRPLPAPIGFDQDGRSTEISNWVHPRFAVPT